MKTRIKARHGQGSVAGFVRTTAVAFAAATAIGALLLATAITPAGEVRLARQATAAGADDGDRHDYFPAQFRAPQGAPEARIEAF